MAGSWARLPLLLTVLVLATHASASEFGDCFQRVDLACRQQVLVSYGCKAEGQAAVAEPNACKGHPNQWVVVNGNAVVCGGNCNPPASAFDQCVTAAAIHCASLLDRSQTPGKP